MRFCLERSARCCSKGTRRAATIGGTRGNNTFHSGLSLLDFFPAFMPAFFSLCPVLRLIRLSQEATSAWISDPMLNRRGGGERARNSCRWSWGVAVRP